MVCSLSALQDELGSRGMRGVLTLDAVRHCAGMYCHIYAVLESSFDFAIFGLQLKWLPQLAPIWNIAACILIGLNAVHESNVLFRYVYDDY